MLDCATRSQKLAMRLAAVAFFSSSLMWGQFTSQIEGTVSDPSRAVVPTATVTLTNVDSGVKSTAQTNSAGYYRFPTLPAATYMISVSASGFKVEEIAGIRVETDQIRTVDVRLQVGAANTAVTVNAEAAAVQLEDPHVSGMIQNAQIQSLPMAGQNFLALTILTPGVIGTTSGTGANVFSGQSQPAINAAGTRQEQNGFAVDGAEVSSMVRHGNTNLQPNEESIDDVQVSVNNFSAENGLDAGATINVLTKSGTNAYHGSLSWFHEDNDLTSRTLFQNVKNLETGRTLPVSRRNEASGSIGGPVIKNKLFLFGAFDILRQSNSDGTLYTVETPQFAQYVEQNFPNNKSAFLLKTYTPTVVPVLGFTTAGTMAGVNCSGSTLITTVIGQMPCNMPVTGEGVSPYAQTHLPWQWNIRGDYNIRDKDRLYVQFYRDIAADFSGSDVRPIFSYIYWFHNYTAAIDETHTFTPTLINEFKTNVTRTLGNILCEQCEIPSITITGMTGFGIGGPTPFSQNNFYWIDSATWIHGKHTVKAGVNFQRLDANWDPEPGYERPSFSFTSVFSFVQDNPFSEGNIGLNPTNGSAIAPAAAERFFRTEAFGEDTWKVTPHLTLSYGMRWQYNGRVAQATGGNNVQFAQNCGSFMNCIATGSDEPTHYVFQHVPMDNFMPRLGVAWDPFGDGKTSVRFGAGVFIDPLQSQVWGGQHYTPPLYEIVTASQNSVVQPLYAFGQSNTDPYLFPRPPSLTGIIGLNAQNGSTTAPSNVVWDNPSLRNPHTYSTFFGIQRSLTSTLTLEANFVGNIGRHLYAQWDVNRYDGDILAGNGVIQRLNPSFGQINYTCACFNSSYVSGNLILRQRLSHGLFIQAAYTYGHARDQADTFGGGLAVQDAYNTKAEWGNAGYDVAQKLATAVVYNIPTPRFSSALVRGAISGWVLNAITVLQTGAPFTVTCSLPFTPVKNSAGAIIGNSGCNYNADGDNFARPNAPPVPLQINYGLNNLVSGAGAFTTSEFPTPCFGCDGNLSRSTYLNPGYANTDMSLQKVWSLPWFTGDRKSSLLLRVDAFNAFNRVNLGGIGANLGSVPTFGKVTATGPARTFQLGAKFRF
jgi:hypothetical protein